jgi:ABC-type multidrug transport system fused ATPase/permease subunit
MFYFLNVVVTLGSITWVGGWRFMIAALLLAGLYKRAASLYSPLSRDLRRLDSLNRSPLYATFSEAIAGIQTIRAYGTSRAMMDKMTKIVSGITYIHVPGRLMIMYPRRVRRMREWL